MATRIGLARGIDEHRRIPEPPEPGRVQLKPGQMACGGCGIVTTGPAIDAAVLDRGGPGGLHTVPLGRCEGCAAVWERAAHIATPDASEAAVTVLGRSLLVFRAMGMSVPDRIDAGDALRWFGRFEIDWASKIHHGTERSGTAASRPWAHIGPEDRATLVEQFSRWLHSRARPGQPLRIPAPRLGDGRPGGCVLCGLGHVEIPAESAAEHFAPGMWRSVSIEPSTVGGTGQRIDGVICQTCDSACAGHDGRRVLGMSSVERALAEHWEGLGHRAEASLVRHGELAVQGWAGAPRKPNVEPWSHVPVPVLGR